MFKVIGIALSALILAMVGTTKTRTAPDASLSVLSISPASGYIGTTVTLAGTSLSLGGNKIYAGAKQVIWEGPSLDGETIVFDVLNTISNACYPGSPCRLWVENEYGKSNALNFTLTGWILPEVQVGVNSPAAGAVFRGGEGNVISWSGGHKVVALGLVKDSATTDFDISSTGMIVGWINTNSGEGYHLPNGSYTWDARQVCDLDLNTGPESNCHFVVPGSYKILVLSEDPTGSMWIATGSGKQGKYSNQTFKGNWNLSETITITR